MEHVILLAEGNAKDAEAALRSFARHGLANQIHLAGDGQDVLDFLLSWTATGKRDNCAPILILLDLALPLNGGLEILRTLRADYRCRRIPIALLTSSELDVSSVRKLNIDCLIEKPVTFNKLFWFATQMGVRLSLKPNSAQRRE
ncbi:MAG TPA: hypothetical protein VJQ82_05050 [Terriglobales bacterium]|nr:hypothetical protein [Terriglobales bacterium]